MNRKEQLLHSAIEIIDEMGYQNFTIRQLAKKQNISEAAIYRYFSNKIDIVADILTYYCDFYNTVREEIKSKNMKALPAIEYYIIKFVRFYEKHPAMLTLSNNCDLLSHEKEISALVSKIVLSRIEFLTELFQKGIDDQEINGLITAESMAYIMTGTMISVSLVWKLQNYNFSLTEKIQEFTNQMRARLVKDECTA